jgi:hypothetical protein
MMQVQRKRTTAAAAAVTEEFPPGVKFVTVQPRFQSIPETQVVPEPTLADDEVDTDKRLEYAFALKQRDLSRHLIELVRQEGDSTAKAYSDATILADILRKNALHLKGPDLMKYLLDVDYTTPDWSNKVLETLTQIRKELPPQLVAAAVDTTKLSKEIGVTKNALGVVSDVVTQTQWLAEPAVLGLLQAYLFGNVSAVANVVPSLAQGNYEALKIIASKLTDTAQNASRYTLYQVVAAVALLVSTVATVLTIAGSMAAGADVIGMVLGVAPLLLLSLCLTKMSHYVISQGVNPAVKSGIQKLNISPRAKEVLGTLPDIALFVIGTAAPVVASFMLRQYCPQITAAEVPATVQQLKNVVSQNPSLDVPLEQSLPGLTRGPLEVEASLRMQTPVPCQTQWSPSATTMADVAQTLKAVTSAPRSSSSSLLSWSTPPVESPAMPTTDPYQWTKEYETCQPSTAAIRNVMAARDLYNVDWAWYLQVGMQSIIAVAAGMRRYGPIRG